MNKDKVFVDSKITYILAFLLISIVALAVFWPGLNTTCYADDYQFVFSEPSSKILSPFTTANERNSFYRPIQTSFMSLVQTLVGLQTWPLHLTQLTLHVILCLLVYIVILKFGFSRLHAGIGTAFMLLSQNNVHAVLSNDTLSQVGGTVFGCMSIWFLYLAYSDYIAEKTPEESCGRIKYKYYIVSGVMLLLSLFSKEQAFRFQL